MEALLKKTKIFCSVSENSHVGSTDHAYGVYFECFISYKTSSTYSVNFL